MTEFWGELEHGNGTAAGDENRFVVKNVRLALAHILGVDSRKKITEVESAIQTEIGASCEKEVRFSAPPFHNLNRFQLVLLIWKRNFETSDNIQNG